jgi:predicted metalloenzyme YecM
MLKKIIFLFILFFYCSGMAIAIDSATFQLTAKVMYIDLGKNLINIAENDIGLLYHYEKDKKVWDTHFLNKEGHQISAEQIKKRDRVVVQGYKKDGMLNAREIILLELKK